MTEWIFDLTAKLVLSLVMDSVERAISILNNGGIVIFPTDTAYGMGCRIDNERSIKRLFKIRRRPENKPTPVLVSGIEMAEDYLEQVPEEVRNLMKVYWPGGLTIVYDCKKKKVPELVRGGGPTIGVRMPNHEIALLLIKGSGVPILGPSANFAGGATPFSFEELDKKLLKEVDYVLKGEIKTKKASTVVDCSEKPWKILRQGAVEVRDAKFEKRN